MGGQDEWLRMHLQPGHNWKCMSSLHTLQCTLAMWRHDKWLVCCCCRCRLPRWRQVIQGNCLNPVYAFYFILLGRHFPPSFSRCVISVSGVCIFDSIAIHTCIYTTHILWSHSIWCVCVCVSLLPHAFVWLCRIDSNTQIHKQISTSICHFSNV